MNIHEIVLWIRHHSLRRVIFTTWIISFAIGIVFAILGIGGTSAVAEMYTIQLAWTSYFVVCALHCISNETVSLKWGKLGLWSILAFFLSMFVVSSDNPLFDYFLSYEGEDSNPILSMMIGLALILDNPIGKILVLSGTGLSSYACWKSKESCESRYGYIFWLLLVSNIAFLYIVMSIFLNEASIWTSNLTLWVFALWSFCPMILFFIIIIKEGRSSIVDVDCKEKELSLPLQDVPSATSNDQTSEAPNVEETKDVNTSLLVEEYSKSEKSPEVLAKEEQTKSDSTVNKINKPPLFIIFGALAVLALVAVIAASTKNSKKENYTPVVCDSVDCSSDDEDYYYNDFDDEDNYDDDSFDESQFNDWILDTYGDDHYLSRQFKELLMKCDEATEATGSIYGPEISCWWWEQEPRSTYMTVDEVGEEDDFRYAVVNANGNSLAIKFIKENGNWVYDDFVETSTMTSFKEFMRKSLVDYIGSDFE